MTTIRRPCPSCPWRVDATAAGIPNFKLELAEALSDSCPNERGDGPDFGSTVFACHQSREGEEFVCAGWLAVVGHRHPVIRMKVMTGAIPMEALEPGEDWPELHASWQDALEVLRATDNGRT